MRSFSRQRHEVFLWVPRLAFVFAECENLLISLIQNTWQEVVYFIFLRKAKRVNELPIW